MRHNWMLVGLALLAMLVPLRQKEDAPSPFESCRFVTPADLKDARAPSFAAYRVAVPKSATIAKLDLKSNPIAREYRTVLRQELAQGPNYAGHYRLAAWGCGSSCTMFAVIDTRTGRVTTPSGFSHTSGTYFGVDDRNAFLGSQSDAWLLAFRKDSRLLVVLGDLDEDESREGAFYFALEKQQLKLVHTTSVEKDCERLRH